MYKLHSCLAYAQGDFTVAFKPSIAIITSWAESPACTAEPHHDAQLRTKTPSGLSANFKPNGKDLSCFQADNQPQIQGITDRAAIHLVVLIK